MPTYTQTDGPLAITTPLGKDVLLLIGFRGCETISQLFNFQLDLLAEVQNEVHFEDILGQEVTAKMTLPNGDTRCFNGIVVRFSQGPRDETFVQFRAEVVPKLWLLTKKVQSRIFQHLSIPDILHQVLTGLDVTYELLATYYPRDFCVQYRESDFDFVSRLMEEEGIHYFFKHADGSHQMVVTDVANQHPDIPGPSNVNYEQASRGAGWEDMCITTWEKTQELRSGEYTLWDHCFELPGNPLEAQEKTIGSVAVGQVNHALKVGGNDQLEIYEYPGGYAQRFDGIDRNGEPRPQDLQSIFRDNQRTVRVRMEQEDAGSLEATGTSDCGHFVAGHKFTLERHFDGDGEYLLTRIEHDAHITGDYRSYQEMAFKYGNRFTCIPVALPYRPQRVTRKPTIAGIQTATVVGPSGEEIFCDQYGRVKVQFHWDREGKNDANSSCWLRVAQVWAGNGWGAFFWPRVGNEVVVVFEEGDPDQPLIVGSVYNAENMPPFGLPINNQLGGLKSCSVRGRSRENFNGVVFDDAKGSEHLSIHSERHMNFNAEYDKAFHAGRHKGERVAVASVFTVGHLPGTGGSGGGPNVLPPSVGGGSGGGSADPPWPKPWPQGVLGLSSSVVYGENMQATLGVNHQLCFGSNFQICVNPAGLEACAPLPNFQIFTEMLGSGIGGNMQLTVGTNVQVVYGRNIEIDAGMPKLEFNGSTKEKDPLGWALVVVMGAIIAAYFIAYAALEADWKRAELTIGFQALMEITLCLMMLVEMVERKLSGEIDKDVKAAWAEEKPIDWTTQYVGEYEGKEMWVSPSAQAFAQALIVVVTAAVLPMVIIADNEKDPEQTNPQGPKH